jgi:hypothetical protein
VIKSRRGLTGVILGAGVIVVAALVGWPLLLAIKNLPAPPSMVCPTDPRQLAGRHFGSSDDLVQAELSCADLRNAVFDGLDLSQADLSGADLRGASLRNADLIQADLSHARLQGADLSFADVTQADLSGADLRGAQLWLTTSIQTQADTTRIGVIESGVVQLGYLIVPGALVVLAIPLLRIVRRIPSPGRLRNQRLRPRVRRGGLLALTAPAAVYLTYMIVRAMVALWAVDILLPLAIGEAILVAAIVVEQLAPTGLPPKDSRKRLRVVDGGD